MAEPLTVTQLNTRVRALLSSTPDVRDIWVSGEISNLTRASSGHYYFVLKDATGEVRCALFARARSRVDFEPRENMKVLAFGSADLYIQRGSYQFIVENMRRSGIGELYQAYVELKNRLEKEGLFDPARKKPLPKYPRRIGVVTSETGAVIHDIITTSASRFPADIILAPAQVQGEGAAATIVSGIRLLDRVGVDVIIVGRGGGSLEDLWPFNEESVARAISECSTPIVSAVGHETDFTIADFVADVRAPTPTGAAAIILRDRSEIRSQLNRDMANAERALRSVLDRMRASFDVLDAKLSPERASRDLDLRSMSLDDWWGRADRSVRSRLSEREHRLALLSSRISVAGASQDVDSRRRALEDTVERIRRAVADGMTTRSNSLAVLDARVSPMAAVRDIESRRTRLEAIYGRASPADAARDLRDHRTRLDSLYVRASSASLEIYRSSSSRLESASAGLASLNPTRVMERGYGIILRPDGQVLTSVSDMLVGEKIDIRLRDGTARAAVREITEDRR